MKLRCRARLEAGRVPRVHWRRERVDGERGRTGVLSFDVTADVASFVAGTTQNLGWILKRRDEERSGRLDLRARESSSPPRLVLTFGVGAAAIALVSGDGQRARPGETLSEPLVVAVRDTTGRGLPGQPVEFAVTAGDASLVGAALSYTDASGVARATVRVGTNAMAGTVVRVSATAQGLPGAQPVSFRAIVLPPPLVLSPVADTYVSRVRPNDAHGGESVLRVGAIGRRRALVRFDSQQLAALLAGAELDRAELELTIAAPIQLPPWCPPRTFEVGVHRVLTPWTEHGATWNSPADTRPTNHRRDGPRWNMGRSPLPFVPQPTSTVPLEQDQVGALRVDVTADLRAFLAGSAANEGWLLKSVREYGPGSVSFFSRETSTPPRLVVYLRDVTAPSITFTEPSEGAFVGLGDSVATTYSDPSGVVVESFSSSVGGVDVTQAFSASAGEARATIAQLAPILAQGPNTFTATIEDAFGNTGTATRTVVFDSVPPVVSLEPADGAVVVSSTLVVRLTAADSGSGVAPDAVSLTVNGAPVTIELEEGVGVVDLAVPAGDYVLVATVEDRAGNRTQLSSSIPLTPRGIRGQILGGRTPDDVQPVAGVRVRALDGPPVETHTDANGEFVLHGSPVGRIGVVADGFGVGFGRTNFVAEVVDGVVTALARPIVVPPVGDDDGVEVVLDAEGRTTSELVITSPDSLAAELRIAAGSRVVLPDDGFVLAPGRPLRISIHRLTGAYEPEPLPAAPEGLYVAPGVYSIQPAGAEIVEGYTLTLANEVGVGPGESTPLFLFSQRTGTWELKAQMVASPDALTVTGTLNSLIAAVLSPLPDLVSDLERSKVGVYPRALPAGAQTVYGGPRRTTIFNEFLTTRLSVVAGETCPKDVANESHVTVYRAGSDSGLTGRTEPRDGPTGSSFRRTSPSGRCCPSRAGGARRDGTGRCEYMVVPRRGADPRRGVRPGGAQAAVVAGRQRAP
jgi:hypothetical protein